MWIFHCSVWLGDTLSLHSVLQVFDVLFRIRPTLVQFRIPSSEILTPYYLSSTIWFPGSPPPCSAMQAPNCPQFWGHRARQKKEKKSNRGLPNSLGSTATLIRGSSPSAAFYVSLGSPATAVLSVATTGWPQRPGHQRAEKRKQGDHSHCLSPEFLACSWSRTGRLFPELSLHAQVPSSNFLAS